MNRLLLAILIAIPSGIGAMNPVDKACKKGIVKQVLKLVKDVNAPINNAKEKPLHLAAFYGHVHLVRELLKKGAQVDAVDNDGSTPLRLACQENHYGVARLLLEHHANANSQDIISKQTPLMQAADKGYDALICLLIEYKAQVDMVDRVNATAVWMAALNNHAVAVQILVDAGADLSIKNIQGLTPLAVSIQSGYKGITEILLRKLRPRAGAVSAQENDAPAAAAVAYQNEQLNEQEVSDESADAPDETGAAALSGALPHLTRQVSQLILNGPDGAGRTLWRACNSGDQRVVAALLQEDDVDMKWQHPKTGQAPLHVVCARGHREILRLLLLKEPPVDLEVQDIHGHTPLRYAVSTSDEKMVEMLIARGADIHARSFKGVSPLQMARKKGNRGVLELFNRRLDELGSDCGGAAGATLD